MRDMKKSKKVMKKRECDKFVGILDKDFKTEDKRYNSIVGCSAIATPNKDKKVR